MTEIRSYASLSGSLLARKGGAKPAMRPRPLSHDQMLDDLGWDDMGVDPQNSPTEHVPSSIAALTPAPKPARDEAAAPPIVAQQQALSERFGSPEVFEPAPAPEAPVAEEPPVRAEAPVLPEAVVTALRTPHARKARRAKAEGPSGRKAAFTLRLDGDRHLRLRLASAVTGKSSQQLVTGALDALLDTLPEVAAMAGRLPARAARGN